jgi:hypothetical protein
MAKIKLGAVAAAYGRQEHLRFNRVDGHRRPRRRVWILALAAGLLLGSNLLAQDASIEDRIKATFIFNFIQFSEWPRSTSGESTFTICILGESFRDVMEETIRGETVNGRPIAVREVMQAKDAPGCHVIYFRNSANRAAAQELLNAAKTSPILTVGETPEFLSNGGIVRFTKVRNRIHFQINPAAAEKVALSLSSRLLRLADIER